MKEINSIMKSKKNSQPLKGEEMNLPIREKEWSTRMKVVWLAFCLIVMGGILPVILNYMDKTKLQGEVLKNTILSVPIGVLIGVTVSKIVTRWIEVVVIGALLGIACGISSWFAMNTGIIEMREAIPSFGSLVFCWVITYTFLGIFLFIVSGGNFSSQSSKESN